MGVFKIKTKTKATKTTPQREVFDAIITTERGGKDQKNGDGTHGYN